MGCCMVKIIMEPHIPRLSTRNIQTVDDVCTIQPDDVIHQILSYSDHLHDEKTDIQTDNTDKKTDKQTDKQTDNTDNTDKQTDETDEKQKTDETDEKQETDETDTHVTDDELTQEYQENINLNIPYKFTDIIDSKHIKYMEKYSNSKILFWGLGIENETYFMVKKKLSQFTALKCKRERYSVDYFRNFKTEPLKKSFDTLITHNVKYPIYINSHSFTETDKHNEHRTIYDEVSTPNTKFTESIHAVLLRESKQYKEMYDSSVVFDGDSIEFITQNFYNTTVDKCVDELRSTKQIFLKEISPYFRQWGEITFPDHNYGFVTFLTTYRRNLGICNNGTYHFNITLPTLLENGNIVDKYKFAEEHLRLISCIQMIEPLLVACYGTPDVLSTINNNAENYSIGSLRVSLSRYISLQTFDVEHPINGKLLLMPKPDTPSFWYNQFETIPYFLNKEIGYDINFNKFKNHGVEIRFFDWFPEEHLSDIMNFIILLAERSVFLSKTVNKPLYNTIICKCVQKGFTAVLTKDECNVILNDLELNNVHIDMSPYTLLCYINDILYSIYSHGEIVKRMSPGMKRPVLVNYNKIAYDLLCNDLGIN